jgi:hypothetical protein
MNAQEARAAWAADKAAHERLGVVLPDVVGYATDEMKRNWTLAMDAGYQPALSTAPNSAVPLVLTTYIDPEVVRVAFAPTEAAVILTERKMGTWLDDTAMFPVVETTGETSSYGDYNTNGSTGVNTNWPQRQSYHFQVMKQYGEREIERAGLSRLNWVAEIDVAAADILNRFSNFVYFFGVQGLQNYGMLNDPSLGASLTPGNKANGGVKWMGSGGLINATANEVYLDIQAMFYQLVTQTSGLVKAKDKMILALSPGVAVALTATNSFGVDVYKLLKQNFPNIRFETAVQYGVTNSQNPQGIAAGNLVQLIAEVIEGQSVAFCAFTEKMRAHKIITDTSSWRQKVTSGAWGSVVRKPIGFASMIGV